MLRFQQSSALHSSLFHFIPDPFPLQNPSQDRFPVQFRSIRCARLPLPASLNFILRDGNESPQQVIMRFIPRDFHSPWDRGSMILGDWRFSKAPLPGSNNKCRWHCRNSSHCAIPFTSFINLLSYFIVPFRFYSLALLGPILRFLLMDLHRSCRKNMLHTLVFIVVPLLAPGGMRMVNPLRGRSRLLLHLMRSFPP